MEVSVKTPMTRITTHVPVMLASLGGTVSLYLILVAAFLVNKVEHAQSLEVVTFNVLVHKVSKSELMAGDTIFNESNVELHLKWPMRPACLISRIVIHAFTCSSTSKG